MMEGKSGWNGEGREQVEWRGKGAECYICIVLPFQLSYHILQQHFHIDFSALSTSLLPTVPLLLRKEGDEH